MVPVYEGGESPENKHVKQFQGHDEHFNNLGENITSEGLVNSTDTWDFE